MHKSGADKEIKGLELHLYQTGQKANLEEASLTIASPISNPIAYPFNYCNTTTNTDCNNRTNSFTFANPNSNPNRNYRVQQFQKDE
jgi:hypothetical protein